MPLAAEVTPPTPIVIKNGSSNLFWRSPGFPRERRVGPHARFPPAKGQQRSHDEFDGLPVQPA